MLVHVQLALLAALAVGGVTGLYIESTTRAQLEKLGIRPNASADSQPFVVEALNTTDYVQTVFEIMIRNIRVDDFYLTFEGVHKDFPIGYCNRMSNSSEMNRKLCNHILRILPLDTHGKVEEKVAVELLRQLLESTQHVVETETRSSALLGLRAAYDFVSDWLTDRYPTWGPSFTFCAEIDGRRYP